MTLSNDPPLPERVTLSDEIAKVLADADPCCDMDCCIYGHAADLADALLTSPALARVIREREEIVGQIEADVLRRVAKRLDEDRRRGRGDWLDGYCDAIDHLYAEADRIEEGAR